MAAAFRFSSLAALTAAVCAPIAMYFLKPGDDPALVLAIFMGSLIFLKHRANIERLRKHEEPRIGASKAAAT